MIILDSAKPRYNEWSAQIDHEWARTAIPTSAGIASTFHVALVSLLEFHSAFQTLLVGHLDDLERGREEALRRAIALRRSPSVTMLGKLLASHGSVIAGFRSEPVDIYGRLESSFSHALAKCCNDAIHIGIQALYDHDLESLEQDRRDQFQAFLRTIDLRCDDNERFNFFLIGDDFCLSGEGLWRYSDWLRGNLAWDFSHSSGDSSCLAAASTIGTARQPHPRGQVPAVCAPPAQVPQNVSLKSLCDQLQISPETLRKYRKGARLRVGRRAVTVRFSPEEIVRLCDYITSVVAAEETRKRAEELKAKYFPSNQFS